MSKYVRTNNIKSPTESSYFYILHSAFCILHSILILAVIEGCGGQTVTPLNPRDATLPIETRRWIAAAEDGVVVARAQRDAARARLQQMELKRERLNEEVEWETGGAALDRAMGELTEAQVRLAERWLEHGEAVLELAQAKYQLANAERAILHDLARYDLEPIRDQVEAARKRTATSREAVRKQREVVNHATTRWWQSYAAYVAAGGDTRPFWIGSASALRVAEAEAHKKGGASRSSVKETEIPQNPFQ